MKPVNLQDWEKYEKDKIKSFYKWMQAEKDLKEELAKIVLIELEGLK